jgi:probable O-glycosylation ligase (exosortase A-associated)
VLPIKTVIYLILLAIGVIGGVIYHPLIGIIGYMLTYNINPAGQWWGSVVVDWGIRYSLILATATAVGILLQRRKLVYKRFFETQEVLLIVFVGLIWLSLLIGLGYNPEVSNAWKMTKVAIIIFMGSHVITDLKRYESMLWTLIIAGLYLGIETYVAPDWMFQGGRLAGGRGLAGSDFSEGNFLGAHFAMLLPFIGVMFLKGVWKSKLVCLVSGVFVTNGIILSRSRGIFLALAAGVISAVVFSIKQRRMKIMFGLSVGIMGAILLTDPGFWNRMDEISVESSKIDKSTKGRILAWDAALSMALDYPLGIGEGNFRKYVDKYKPDIPGKDTHNTFLRCLSELGVQGLIVYLLMIANAFNILRKLKKQVKGMDRQSDFVWHIYGIKISIILFVSAGMFISHTYIEELYWLLMFPVFLKRSVENQLSKEKVATVNP